MRLSASVLLVMVAMVVGFGTAKADDPRPANQVDISEFNHLDPKNIVPDKPLERAVIYFKKNRSKFANQNYIVIVDYTKSASQKRMFIINMKTGGVDSYAAAHGKGSDPSHTGRATNFSNGFGTNASSIGFFKTAETYMGNHGRSLRLDGLSKTNSNARARAIVIHSNWYVSQSAATGRSWGCIVVADSVRDSIIDRIKGGAMIYSYAGQGAEL